MPPDAAQLVGPTFVGFAVDPAALAIDHQHLQGLAGHQPDSFAQVTGTEPANGPGPIRLEALNYGRHLIGRYLPDPLLPHQPAHGAQTGQPAVGPAQPNRGVRQKGLVRLPVANRDLAELRRHVAADEAGSGGNKVAPAVERKVDLAVAHKPDLVAGTAGLVAGTADRDAGAAAADIPGLAAPEEAVHRSRPAQIVATALHTRQWNRYQIGNFALLDALTAGKQGAVYVLLQRSLFS